MNTRPLEKKEQVKIEQVMTDKQILPLAKPRDQTPEGPQGAGFVQVKSPSLAVAPQHAAVPDDAVLFNHEANA
jgi:hypothetical protein